MNQPIEQKLIDLESSLGLLQRDFEKQNEMLLENTRQIQQMQLSIQRLFDQVAQLQTNPESSRLLEDEKPPHY